MYAVVGCRDCDGLWLVSDPGDAETARCPRCGTRHSTDRLRRLYESSDREAVREARAAMLAERRGESEAFAEVDHVADLERAVADAGVDDREYLEASGLDADAVADAGDVSGGSGGSSRPREAIVREAVREASPPTEDAVVDYAAGRGVPAGAARDLLDRLVREGEATASGGEYRLL